MDKDRRTFNRFLIPLKIEARTKNKSKTSGLVKDFSRKGMRVVFNRFNFRTKSNIDIKVQRPRQNVLIPAIGKVIWKRPIEKKWEVGLELKTFPAEIKAEILEHAYNDWIKEKRCSRPKFSI